MDPEEFIDPQSLTTRYGGINNQNPNVAWDQRNSKPMAAPDLKDAPLQKKFLANFAEFDKQLLIVTILSIFVVIIGMIGKWITMSSSLLHTSFFALALNLNWFIGVLLSYRIRNELKRIQYSNLNG